MSNDLLGQVRYYYGGIFRKDAERLMERAANRIAELEFIKQAPVASGTCCCGDDMKSHALGSHSPVDMWDHSVWYFVQEIAHSDK